MSKIDIKTLKKEERQLNREISERRRRVEEIRDILNTKKNSSFLKKYYKVINRYSGGEEWYLYMYTNFIDENGQVYGFSFQKTSIDKIEIEEKYLFYPESWTEITKEEFQEAWTNILVDTQKYTNLIQGK